VKLFRSPRVWIGEHAGVPSVAQTNAAGFRESQPTGTGDAAEIFGDRDNTSHCRQATVFLL